MRVIIVNNRHLQDKMTELKFTVIYGDGDITLNMIENITSRVTITCDTTQISDHHYVKTYYNKGKEDQLCKSNELLQNICKIKKEEPFQFLSIYNILPWNVTPDNTDIEEEDGVMMLKKLKENQNTELLEIQDNIFYKRRTLWQNQIRYKSFKYE